MKLFLNWNGRNAIVATALGYFSMTMSSSFTSSSSSSSSGEQQQQQGLGFLLYVEAADKECTCTADLGFDYPCTCPNEKAEEGCCPKPKPTDMPSSTPTTAPSVPIDCKDDDEKITLQLEKQDKKFTCEKIKQKELCGEKVKGEGDATAEMFCTSCGCGGGDPGPGPTPTLCLVDSDTLQLTTKKKEQTCAKIEEKKLCDDAVENQEDKTAADFCLSCGVCGGSAPPTPSPPDEGNCKGADDTLKLKEKGEKTCAKIEEKGLCKEKVEKEEQDGEKKKASDFCTSCGCED